MRKDRAGSGQCAGSKWDTQRTKVCACMCVALKLSGHETITHLSSQINEASGWKQKKKKSVWTKHLKVRCSQSYYNFQTLMEPSQSQTFFKWCYLQTRWIHFPSILETSIQTKLQGKSSFKSLQISNVGVYYCMLHISYVWSSRCMLIHCPKIEIYICLHAESLMSGSRLKSKTRPNLCPGNQ